MKKISKITVLLVAAVSLTAVVLATSCNKNEFVVEPTQLYGTWYFPLNLMPDTVTGFNWAGAAMTIMKNDTILVDYEPSKAYRWTLRDNNVTATCTPRPNVDEHYVIAFTVYELTGKSMKISGKYRYLYNGDNEERGDISCTLSKTPLAK